MNLFTMLLVQFLTIFFPSDDERVLEYNCTKVLSKKVIFKEASVQLSKGCVMEGVEVTFDVKAMYEAAAKAFHLTAVVINITEAAFIDSYIKLVNADSIPDALITDMPLQFTM
eukprot:Tbor_TRINITY_DN6004_c0_g2::TRINITY_DN6004_c0_g2_i1::g.10174::m.10174